MRTKSITSVILLLVMLIAAFLFVGCDDRQKISFMVDGRVYKTIHTNGYESIEMPEAPQKKGYVFDDWYWNTDYDASFHEDSLKSSSLTVNLKVYARFVKEDASSITNVTLSNSLQKIEARQFEDYSSLESITIPKSVKTIGENAFQDCNSLKQVHITDLNSWCKIKFENLYSNPLFYAKNLYLNGELVTDLVIPNKLKTINKYAFYNGSFKTVSIPNSVKEIGTRAFIGCTELKKLTIPDSVEKIYTEAFKDCTALESVTMGNSVTEVEGNAFQSCNAIKRVDITDLENWLKIKFRSEYSNPLVFAHKLYLNNELVTDVVIPDSVQEIQNYAFQNYTDLKSVVIGNGVTSIGQYAFYGCTSLESVVIGNSVVFVHNNSFKYSAIKNLTIPNSVKYISSSAFESCSSLESVTMGNSVESISLYAFKDCTSLKRVDITDLASWCNIEFDNYYDSNPLYYAQNLYLNNTLITDLVVPDGVTKINDCVFGGYDKLKSVTLPDSVTSIGSSAFNSCYSLEFVDFGNSVTKIMYSAFDSCFSLKDIIVPTKLTSIDSFAFDDCYDLSNVFYLGSENQWTNGPLKYAFSDATKYFFSETQPTTEGNFWHWVDDKPTIWASNGN